MNEILVFTVCLSIFTSLYIVLLYKYISLKKDFKDVVSNSITTYEEFANKKDQEFHEESFIKFISDSREAAFEYIDVAQKQIKDFIEVADEQFAFFDSYGMLTEGQLYYETMKTLSDEYKKLKSLLPEEDVK